MKVDFQGKKGLWLNFPNWATYLPAADSPEFNADPSSVRTEGNRRLAEQFYMTPLAESPPELTMYSKTIKTFDNSNFGSTRASWKGGYVMTNRNQNDFRPKVFGKQSRKNPKVPPLFGWMLSQIHSQH